MKKLIFVFLLCPILLPSFAQEDGLRNVIGGQFKLQLNSTNEYDSKSRDFEFQPHIAWKISKHSLLGIRFGYGRSLDSYTSTSLGGTKYTDSSYKTSLTAGIFTRHYLRPAAKFGLFFEPFLGYYGTKTKEKSESNGNNQEKGKFQQFGGYLSPGIFYHITERLGLLIRLGQVGYIVGKETYRSDSTTRFHDFRFDFALTSLNWGVEYRWGKGGN